MRRPKQSIGLVTLAALLLSACGGGDGGSGPVVVPPTPTPTPTPTPPVSECELDGMTGVDKALADFYRFDTDITAPLDHSQFRTAQAYLDARVAPARALGKDRSFSYIGSTAQESAFVRDGTTTGFGFILSYDAAAGRAIVAETHEGTPALAAGIDRGTEIVAVGTSGGTLRTAASIVAAEGTAGLAAALGPNDVGTVRTLRISDAGGTRDVSVTKAQYAVDPMSARYGASIITEGGRKYGYLNMRGFFVDAQADLRIRQAFSKFRDENIEEIIIDLRYNAGGGEKVWAEILGDLLAGRNTPGESIAYYRYNTKHARVLDEARGIRHQLQTIRPKRIAFIGTRSTAATSELVMNSLRVLLPGGTTLVGSNSFGKPVMNGNMPSSLARCDITVSVPYFTMGSARFAPPSEQDVSGDYNDGLARKFTNSCAAVDDLRYPLGDPRETSIRTALDYLSGQACTTRIPAGNTPAAYELQMVQPNTPSAAQRKIPGLF